MSGIKKSRRDLGPQLAQRRLKIEPLEPRRVLAAGGLAITEFLASNDSINTDSFGDSSDWIELFNDSAATIDLSQYHLTDDATDLEKYALPAANLLAGESILVFASGRDLVTAGGEVHTNFSLSAAGEYLALTDSNGVVVQDFGVQYPAQFDDISYGIETFSSGNPISIVSPAATGTLLIPDAATGPALGLDWIDPAFNDSSWTSATLPIGYEAGSGNYGALINTTVPTDTNSAYLRIPFSLNTLADANDLTLNVRFDDGFVAYLNGNEIFRDRAPAFPAWDSRATANHSDGDAVNFQPFSVADARQHLQIGQNVLALHALNFSPGGAGGGSTVNVDFTSFSAQSGLAAAPDVAGSAAIWNASANGQIASGVVDSTGQTTPVGISIDNEGVFFGPADQEVSAGAGVSDLLSDYLFQRDPDGNESRTGSITGLIPGNRYDLYIYGQGDNFTSNNNGGGQNLGVRIGNEVRHTGWDGVSGGDGNLEEDVEYVLFDNVTADATGTITFEHFNPGTGAFGADPSYFDSDTGSPDLDGNNSQFSAINGLQVVGDFLNTGAVSQSSDFLFEATLEGPVLPMEQHLPDSQNRSSSVLSTGSTKQLSSLASQRSVVPLRLFTRLMAPTRPWAPI